MGEEGGAYSDQLALHLDDRDSAVKKAVAEALGQLGLELGIQHGKGPAYAKEVATRMKDQDRHVRCAAAESVESLAHQSVLLSFQGGLLEAATDQAASIAVGLKDKDRHVRRAALEALDRLGPGSLAHAAEAAKLLLDDNRTVQKAALEALTSMGDGGGAAVVELLADSDWRVRCAALQALSHMGPVGVKYRSNVDQLRNDKDPHVRQAAKLALGGVDRASQVIEEEQAQRRALEEEMEQERLQSEQDKTNALSTAQRRPSQIPLLHLRRASQVPPPMNLGDPLPDWTESQIELERPASDAVT